MDHNASVPDSVPWDSPSEENGRPASCSHDVQQPRVRTLSNGARAAYWQCLTCGAGVRAVRKDEQQARWDAQNVNPLFDTGLRDAWDRQERAAWDAWRSRLVQGQARQNSDWWARYDAYLQTDEWRSRRRERLEFDRFACQARLGACQERAEEVHHLTYAHVFNEPRFDLISVCRACHVALTDMDRAERRRDDE